MATETTTSTDRGLRLPCPLCGEANAAVSLSLAEPNLFTCDECGCDFSREQLDTLIRSWTRVLAWVDQLPRACDLEPHNF